MNGQASMPEIMEIPIQKIRTDTAVDYGRDYSASYIADFIKTMENTQSNIRWPILVNHQDKEFRLIFGMFYLNTYFYLGFEKVTCIVYQNLNRIDEIGCASATQMCKPTAGARLQHFIYLYEKAGIGKGKKRQARQEEIGRVMCETRRQIHKYEYIYSHGSKQLIQDVLDNKVGMNLAIQLIKKQH